MVQPWSSAHIFQEDDGTLLLLQEEEPLGYFHTVELHVDPDTEECSIHCKVVQHRDEFEKVQCTCVFLGQVLVFCPCSETSALCCFAGPALIHQKALIFATLCCKSLWKSQKPPSFGRTYDAKCLRSVFQKQIVLVKAAELAKLIRGQMTIHGIYSVLDKNCEKFCIEVMQALLGK